MCASCSSMQSMEWQEFCAKTGRAASVFCSPLLPCFDLLFSRFSFSPLPGHEIGRRSAIRWQQSPFESRAGVQRACRCPLPDQSSRRVHASRILPEPLDPGLRAPLLHTPGCPCGWSPPQCPVGSPPSFHLASAPAPPKPHFQPGRPSEIQPTLLLLPSSRILPFRNAHGIHLAFAPSLHLAFLSSSPGHCMTHGSPSDFI
jgi:hypothetical protein